MHGHNQSAHATEFSIPSDKSIVMTRVFDAPRDLVFKMYTDPGHIPDWWGPVGLQTTVERMDVRPGGTWRFTQRDKEGKEYAFNGRYREIAPSEKLVSTFEFEGWPGRVSIDTATFEEKDGKTTLRTVTEFQTREDRDAMLQSGMESGATETMDRLAELVEAMTSIRR